MDFIINLLKLRKLSDLNIYNYILIIINQFIKIVHYISIMKEFKVKKFTHFIL